MRKRPLKYTKPEPTDAPSEGCFVYISEDAAQQMAERDSAIYMTFAERLALAIDADQRQPEAVRSLDEQPTLLITLADGTVADSSVRMEGTHICCPQTCRYLPLVRVATHATCVAHEAALRNAGVLSGQVSNDPGPEDIWVCTKGGVYHDCRENMCREVELRDGYLVCWKSGLTRGIAAFGEEHNPHMSNRNAQILDDMRVRAMILGEEGEIAPPKRTRVPRRAAENKSVASSQDVTSLCKNSTSCDSSAIEGESYLGLSWYGNVETRTFSQLAQMRQDFNRMENELETRRVRDMAEAENWRIRLLEVLYGRAPEPYTPFVTEDIVRNAEVITRTAIFDSPYELAKLEENRGRHSRVWSETEIHKRFYIAEYATLLVRAWILVDITRNVKALTNIMRMNLRTLGLNCLEQKFAEISVPATTSSEARYFSQIWKPTDAVESSNQDLASTSANPPAQPLAAAPVAEQVPGGIKTRAKCARLTKFVQIGYGMLYTASTGYQLRAHLGSLGVSRTIIDYVNTRIRDELHISNFTRDHALLFVAKDPYLWTKLESTYSKKNCRNDRRSGPRKMRMDVGTINSGSSAIGGCLAALADWLKMRLVYDVVVREMPVKLAVRDFDHCAIIFRVNC